MKKKLRLKEEQLAKQQQQYNSEISQLSEELEAQKISNEEKVRQYEELLDLRVLLEQEIATLSALLREEEIR